ncbi:MAG TPA: hypothetical protein PKE29_16445 [Phycisphaerales bacterium]|nr:hypothetical protein [Phycisphaerales bacterium]
MRKVDGSNPEKVVQVLKTPPLRWLCDDCVAHMADITNRVAVNPITTTLGLTTDFAREKSRCDHCHDTKLVTKCLRP